MATQAPNLMIMQEHHHVSEATYLYMREEIARLQAENAQLTRDVAYWEQQTNHWYMRAHYTDEELRIMYLRRSRGQDQLTGEWLTPEQQEAIAAMYETAAHEGPTPPHPRERAIAA